MKLITSSTNLARPANRSKEIFGPFGRATSAKKSVRVKFFAESADSLETSAYHRFVPMCRSTLLSIRLVYRAKITQRCPPTQRIRLLFLRGRYFASARKQINRQGRNNYLPTGVANVIKSLISREFPNDQI